MGSSDCPIRLSNFVYQLISTAPLNRTLPTFTTQSFTKCLYPYTVWLLDCIRPFLPQAHRFPLRIPKVNPRYILQTTTRREPISVRQFSLYAKALHFVRPLCCSYISHIDSADWPFTSGLSYDLLPSRMPDIYYLTATDNCQDRTFTC